MNKFLFLIILLGSISLYGKNSKECEDFAKAKAYIDSKTTCPLLLHKSCKTVKNSKGIPVKCYLGYGEKADIDKQELDTIYKKTIQKIKNEKRDFIIFADDK